MKVIRLTCFTATIAACFSASQLFAAIIPGSISETIVESRLPGGALNSSVYAEVGAFGSGGSWANSTAKSTAPGLTGTGSRFNSNAEMGAYFEIDPVLPTAGGTYNVYATVTGASGAINATIGVLTGGGSGLPSTTNAFSVDPVAQPGNTWNLIGTLTLNPGVNNPTIRFTEVTHNNRLYADGILFAEVNLIPEPATCALAGLGLIGLIAVRRRG